MNGTEHHTLKFQTLIIERTRMLMANFSVVERDLFDIIDDIKKCEL